MVIALWRRWVESKQARYLTLVLAIIAIDGYIGSTIFEFQIILVRRVTGW